MQCPSGEFVDRELLKGVCGRTTGRCASPNSYEPLRFPFRPRRVTVYNRPGSGGKRVPFHPPPPTHTIAMGPGSSSSPSKSMPAGVRSICLIAVLLYLHSVGGAALRRPRRLKLAAWCVV